MGMTQWRKRTYDNGRHNHSRNRGYSKWTFPSLNREDFEVG